MACIIRMSSDEFLDKFINKFDYKKFNFLLISEDITTINKYKNVYSIPSLIPPPNIISHFINDGKQEKFIKTYLDYLSTPRVEAMITIMVKLAIVDNANVVLLCSKAENEFNYIDVICQYIETVYGVETYSYKQYKKNPEKCEEVSDKVKKKVSKVLEKKIGDIKDLQPPKMTKKEIKAAIKPLNRKQMKKILMTYGIKFDAKESKKELRKRLTAGLTEGVVHLK